MILPSLCICELVFTGGQTDLCGMSVKRNHLVQLPLETSGDMQTGNISA